MPTKLLFVRHGETLDNRRRIFQGQAGDGLSPLGREQAALLAERLVTAGARFDALYTSDLLRASETADILGRALRLTPAADEGLREVYLGAWQRLHESEIRARFPDEWAAWRRGEDIARGGGELLSQVAARMASTTEQIALRHPHGNVLLVSHGAAIKSLTAHVLAVAVPRLRPLRPVANMSTTLFERAPDGAYGLVLYNDTSHLEDALITALRG